MLRTSLGALGALALALSLSTTLARADDAGTHDAHAAAPYTAGDLEITAPFTRATLPNAPVGGAYLTITNHGSDADRLVSAHTDAAGRTEIHEMAMEGDIMRMRELPDGLPIPAGATVELAPGGFHLMMMELAAPLVEGGSITVTLTFEHAGEIAVAVPVKAPGARSAGHDAHTDHAGDGNGSRGDMEGMGAMHGTEAPQ